MSWAAPGDEDTAVPLAVGWTRREAAHAWGEQLLEALLAAGYEAEVRVHQDGPWYRLILVGEGEQWLLDTLQQVQEVLTQLSRLSQAEEERRLARNHANEHR